MARDTVLQKRSGSRWVDVLLLPHGGGQPVEVVEPPEGVLPVQGGPAVTENDLRRGGEVLRLPKSTGRTSYRLKKYDVYAEFEDGFTRSQNVTSDVFQFRGG